MKDFKGHVKITLRDSKTNEIQQVVEGDNVVTDAVKELLENNVLGCVDYSKIYPLGTKWFKGCLCMSNAFPEVDGHPDPSKIFIPDDSVNHVIAHAGDTVPQDYADDLKRGEPNTHVEITTQNSIKYVWEWSPTQGNCQGNETINAIALTHKDIGNAGTGSTSDAFRALNPFEFIQVGLDDFRDGLKVEDNVIGRHSGNLGWWFEIGDPGDYTKEHTAFSTNKITLYLKRIAFDEIGLYDTTHASNEFNIHKTITLDHEIYCQPAYYVNGTTLHLFTNITGFQYNNIQWNNTIRHWTISWPNPEVDPTVTYNTISTGRSDIAPLTLDYKCGYQEIARPIFVGIPHGKNGSTGYWFFPCSDVTTVNYSTFVHNVKGYARVGGGSTKYIPLKEVQTYFRSSMHGTELCPIVMPGRVVNGNFGYTCQDQLPITDPWRIGSYGITSSEAVSSYAVPIGSGSLNTYNVSRYIIANKFLTTTRFNLPSPITKTASQSMTVEYTITEV